MSEPTPDQVRGLWAHMNSKYGSVVLQKSSSELMQVVSDFLGKMNISDPQDFMRKYTTTIGRRIYAPFEIGTPNDNWGLWDQMIVCVHEHQHIVQQDEDGALAFGWRYVTDAEARAWYEANAYITAVEMDMWRFGKIDYEPESLVQRLSDYGCNADQIAFAGSVIRVLGHATKSGGIVTKSSRDAIAWLEESGSEIIET